MSEGRPAGAGLVARSLLYNLAYFALTVLWCLALLVTLPFPRRVMMAGVLVYLRLLVFLEAVLLGLRYRVTGQENLPPRPFILAAKHQSTWETMKLHLLVPDLAIVLKRELMYLPLWGWFAAKARMIPVRRGGGAGAIRALAAAARNRLAAGRVVAIFPEGTRTAPGERRPYRGGIAAVYEGAGVPVVPMALNSGVFWPRRAFVKRAGLITVAFLPPIPPGLPRAEMMARLEAALEPATDRLVAEARRQLAALDRRGRNEQI